MLSFIRHTVPVWVALLLATALGLVAVPAADATTTTLCKGYWACAKAGMGHAGYQSAGSAAYWRMYAGHNCTNYAAYRLVRGGMPNERPWSGGGNAERWGVVKASITDQEPAVGAIAWWKANVPGAGSAGHVAYVERVVSPDEIIVSQDSWGGDFSWARITREGRGWPSGFIHFDDRLLENTVKPVIEGAAKVVDGTLTASVGQWTSAPESFSFQWLADGEAVPGATGQQLRLRPNLVGKALSVRVTAQRAGFDDVSATSTPTEPVRQGTLTVRSRPRVSGTPRLGRPLTLARGSMSLWASPSVQWLRDGVPVEGATGSTYTPSVKDLGRRLTATVTWTRSGYRTVRHTAARTATVKAVPSVTVRTSARRGGRVTLTATVKAAGSSPVESVVRVRSAGRQLAERPLRNGTATVTLTGLHKGSRTVQLLVPGNARVAPAVVAQRLRIT